MKLSISELANIPNIININDNKIVNNGDVYLFRHFIDSGIKSRILIHIMTPPAKEQAAPIIKSLFLILKKIGKVPKSVDKPAKVVNKNG